MASSIAEGIRVVWVAGHSVEGDNAGRIMRRREGTGAGENTYFTFERDKKMKLRTTVCLLAGLLLTASLAGRVMSQDPGQAGGEMPDSAEMKKMMEKWMATISPSEHHKHLNAFVGSWNTHSKMWWEGPGKPAVETDGTSEVKWVLGKRYIQEHYHGSMMMPDESGGMAPVPYEGIGLTGYDNYKNLYIGTWANNLSTELLIRKGGRDPSGKLFTSYGTMDEAMLDVHDRMIKYVWRIINDDKHMLEIYDLHAGDGYKVIEITYTRKK